jgi:hypothetical protein
MHFNVKYNKILLRMLHCHVNYFHIYVTMIEINSRFQWYLSFLWMCGSELSSTYCGISSLNMLQDLSTYGKVCYLFSLLVVVRSCISASTSLLYTNTCTFHMHHPLGPKHFLATSCILCHRTLPFEFSHYGILKGGQIVSRIELCCFN